MKAAILGKSRRAPLSGIIGGTSARWGAGHTENNRRGMSTEENKATSRRLWEESFGEGKPELVDELLDPDFVRYDPYIEAGQVRGTQTVKENIVWFRNAFPDLTCTVEDQVGEGDKVLRAAGRLAAPTRGSSSGLPARAIGWSSRASR